MGRQNVPMPEACTTCGRPLYKPGTPKAERAPRALQYAGRGICSSCNYRLNAAGSAIPMPPTEIATKVLDRRETARRALAGDWVESAVCRSLDPELWFSETPSDIARAAAFCAVCPVQALCAQKAEDAREQYGVWGGVKRNAKPERGRVVEVAA